MCYGAYDSAAPIVFALTMPAHSNAQPGTVFRYISPHLTSAERAAALLETIPSWSRIHDRYCGGSAKVSFMQQEPTLALIRFVLTRYGVRH